MTGCHHEFTINEPLPPGTYTFSMEQGPEPVGRGLPCLRFPDDGRKLCPGNEQVTARDRVVIVSPGHGVMNADTWLTLTHCPSCQQRTGIHDWHRLTEENGHVTGLVWFHCPEEAG